MQKKLLQIALILSLCFPVLSFAETIVLKSGKTVEGKLIEKTDRFVKIDFQGIPITYFFDEIDTIDGKKPELISRESGIITGVKSKVSKESYPLSIGNSWYYNMIAYFPEETKNDSPIDLTKGIGSSYTRKIVGKDIVNNKEVFIEEMYGTSQEILEEREYLSQENGSLLCYKREIYQNGQKVYDKTFNPPEVMAKFNLEQKEKWELPDGGTTEFIGIEKIDTPAGTFQAYMFEISVIENSEEAYVVKYYVPHIGLVAEITVKKGKKGNFAIDSKLAKYNIQ